MRFLNMMVPLPPPWNNATEVSSILIRSGALPAGTLAAQQLYHCHTACAWIWTFWGRKLDPFLVPESGTRIGPGRGHFSKDYYKGAGNWTRYWCRNLAPKLVPDSGRAGSFLGRGRGRNPAPPLVPDSAPDPTQKRPRQSFSCISATGVPSRRRSLP